MTRPLCKLFFLFCTVTLTSCSNLNEFAKGLGGLIHRLDDRERDQGKFPQFTAVKVCADEWEQYKSKTTSSTAVEGSIPAKFLPLRVSDGFFVQTQNEKGAAVFAATLEPIPTEYYVGIKKELANK